MKQWETSTATDANALTKKRVWFIFRTDLTKMQHFSAYTPAGPADVSITQSITLDFGKATFRTEQKRTRSAEHTATLSTLPSKSART